jgi:hypothetical protein
MRPDDLVEAVRAAPKCVRGSWYTVRELADVLGLDVAGLTELLNCRDTSNSPAARAGLIVQKVQIDYGGPQLKYYYVSFGGETPMHYMRSERERSENASAVSVAREARRERCTLRREICAVVDPAVPFSPSRASTEPSEYSHQQTGNSEQEEINELLPSQISPTGACDLDAESVTSGTAKCSRRIDERNLGLFSPFWSHSNSGCDYFDRIIKYLHPLDRSSVMCALISSKLLVTCFGITATRISVFAKTGTRENRVSGFKSFVTDGCTRFSRKLLHGKTPKNVVGVSRSEGTQYFIYYDADSKHEAEGAEVIHLNKCALPADIADSSFRTSSMLNAESPAAISSTWSGTEAQVSPASRYVFP